MKNSVGSMPCTMKFTLMLITAMVAVMANKVVADDYSLEAGLSETLSTHTTYGKMTVNGALTLANGGQYTKITAASLTVGGDAEHGYGNVSVVVSPQLVVTNLTLETVAGLASSDPIAYLTLTNASVTTVTITNNSSRAARIDCYGVCSMLRQSQALRSDFNHGDHEVVLHNGAVMEFRHGTMANSQSVVSAGEATLKVAGEGDAKFLARSTIVFSSGVQFAFGGDIYLAPVVENRTATYEFGYGDIIGPNVKWLKSSWTDFSSAAATVSVAKDIALAVPSVDICQAGATLQGKTGSSVLVDARSEARTFKANIPAGNPLEVCVTGTCEVVVSSTTNIPHLVVSAGSRVRFTERCVVEGIAIGEGASVIADGCEVVLAGGFAVEGRLSASRTRRRTEVRSSSRRTVSRGCAILART